MTHSQSDASAPTHPTAAVPSAIQLRSVLHGDLRALALPPQAMVTADTTTPILETTVEQSHWRRLGEYLRAHDLITEQDLAAALAEQRQRIAQSRPIALGDLLVEQGHLTAQELVTVLMLQLLDRRQATSAQTSPPLGELLVRARLITAEQLAAALTTQTEARQRGEVTRLGEILIASGVLARRDLATSLVHQRRSRRS
jgi:hypothetical protein